MNSRLHDLQRIASSCPSEPRAQFELGCAALASGAHELAVKCFTEVTRLAPSVAAGHFNLGNAYFSLKNFKLAAQAYEQSLAIAPDRATLNNAGNALAALGSFEAALERYQLVETLPDDGTPLASTLKNMGAALEAAGRWSDAQPVFRRAVELSASPVAVLLVFVRLMAKYAPAQALAELQKHQEVVARSPELLALQGDCRTALHQYSQAIGDLMAACQLSPEHATVLASLGRHYAARGRHFESMACFHRSLAHRSGAADVHSAWLNSLTHQAKVDWPEFKTEAARWDELFHESGQSQSDGHLVDSQSSHTLRVEEYPQHQPRQLQLGIVAGTQGLAEMSNFLKPLLKHANHQSYAVTLYVDRLADQFENLRHYQSEHVRFVSALPHSDVELTRLIRRQSIDVLFDLCGHGSGNRMPVFASRAAPVQVSWGCQGATTGLSTMDLKLVDDTAVSSDQVDHFSEVLFRHTSGMFSCVPSMSAPEVSERDGGSSSANVGVICSPAQLLDASFALLARILRSLPQARLKLADDAYSDPTIRHEVLERFRVREIDTQRVELVTLDNTAQFLAEIDVCLDPTPLNCVGAACTSLLAGVPVVCLLGSTLSARLTASLLTSAGLTEWVCSTAQEYCQRVAQVVEQPPARGDLIRRINQSALCDDKTWCQGLVQALRTYRKEAAFGGIAMNEC